MFIQLPFLKRKVRSLALRVFNWVENNGSANFERNGERVFIQNLFKSFKGGEPIVIFDIGANIGEYSEMLSEYALKYNKDVKMHLFEPTKGCFSVISKKFSGRSDIILNNFGVSNEKARTAIYYDKEKSVLASLYQRDLTAYGLELDQAEDIMLQRMDTYIKESGIKHISFIKIDIEGHELVAFEGFSEYLDADFIDYIQFEYGGTNLDSHSSLIEIYALLESKGFKLAKVMPSGLEMRSYSPFMENFNYSNYVAISKRLLEK